MNSTLENAPDAGCQAEHCDRAGFLLLLIVTISIGLRFYVPIAESFPINDGGLFLQMMRDILANNWILPAYTSYNQSQIPFAYPPLAFYLTAFVHLSTGIELIELVRVLPPFWCSLMLWPAWIVIKELNTSLSSKATALAVFGVSYPGFEWAIMGGGVTRALGFLLALTSIALLTQALHWRSRRKGILSLMVAALAGLTHPQAWLFLVASSVPALLMKRNKIQIGTICIFLGLICLTLLPWLALELYLHGFATLEAALLSSYTHPENLFRTIDALVHGFFGLSLPINLLFALGLVEILLTRTFAPLSWFILVSALPRFGAINQMLPIAVIAGFGATFLLRALHAQQIRHGMSFRFENSALLIVLVIALQLADSFVAVTKLRSETMQPSERQALAWIARNTPVDAKFVIITERVGRRDYLSEWFPTITGRESLLTFEGKEWLGQNEFFRVYGLRFEAGELLKTSKLKPSTQMQEAIRKADFALVDSAGAIPTFTGNGTLKQKLGTLELYERPSLE